LRRLGSGEVGAARAAARCHGSGFPLTGGLHSLGEAVMARKCMLSGKRANVGHSVSHSNRKTKMRQFVNLQKKRVWWPSGDRWVTLRVSTRAMRTIDKIGLEAYAERAGVDLSAH
jgi:large subunit ribosomal protein L28